MTFEYLTNIPLDQARKIYLDALTRRGLKPSIETVDVANALDRVTSRAVYARICAPHYNACAMDGIALKASLTFGATETTPIKLRENEYFWVNTGDPLPVDCDSVVMIEDVIADEGSVNLYTAAVPWQHVRQIGEDISAGDMIVPSFTPLTPSALGALLETGVDKVEVIKRPIVGIIPTGNELIVPGENPKEGDIIESNSTIFAGILTNWGCCIKVYQPVRDTADLIEAALKTALNECDAVILNAGSSAGKKDYSVEAISRTGEVILHGIAIKPGKPAILGLAQDRSTNSVKPILGLPGYPVSGILVMEQLFKPLIDMLTCRISEKSEFIEAVISRRLTSSLKYLEFVRSRLGNVNGRVVAVPLNRGAGVVSSFVKADGIIHIPQDSEGYEAGEKVRVQLLRSMEEINHTLVITGSHDPLIDEVVDIMKHRWRDSLVASAHVGSLGGIMAVKRGEAHLGGIHLLDEDSGDYNIPYIKKHFPDGHPVLVECVQRTQGLMIPKGNPKGIKSFMELVGMRYVNRQKGSGTRILCDYLMKQQGIESGQITGYTREEFTHTAVAAAIAAGTADAGLGVLSAARIYDLDFIPVCEEQYDLLIAESAFDLDIVQRLLDVLKSPDFSKRINSLGGYTIVHPGEIRQWN